MKIDDKKLKEILSAGNYLTVEDLKIAEGGAKKSRQTLVDYLLGQQLLTKDLLGQALAEFYGVPYADLNTVVPSRQQVLKMPEEMAKKYQLVLFKEGDKENIIATDDPAQKNLAAILGKIFVGKKIKLAYSLPEDIETNFIFYRKALDTRFSDIINKKDVIAPEIVGEIFKDAVDLNASDIHFEPMAEEVVIRFRIDGVLQEAGRIPKKYYQNIINRLKIEAHLRIDEHQKTQDGAIRFASDWGEIDLRLSIVPVIEGEKMVLRLLAKHLGQLSLDNLGLTEANQKILLAASRKPFGMIIVAGPTGSGKTTTLYALIKILDRPEVNITTIEDPVEYKIPTINQIQINQATDITFVRGLRSIVRQDPDIILVGEIRDQETAEIAVNAALTGHLLLSTFHANNASTVIPRLLDMKIEPFLLASTLEIILSQRLVRKICDHCRYSAPVSQEQLGKLPQEIAGQFSKKGVIYKGKGCPVCNQTGYLGRTSLFEIIRVTPEFEELVMNNPSAQSIWRLARQQGSRSMFEDGIEKIKNGLTTFEEVFRVAPPN